MARKSKRPRLSSAKGRHTEPAPTSTAASSGVPASGDNAPLYFFGAGNPRQGFLSQWFDRHPFTDPGPLKFNHEEKTTTTTTTEENGNATHEQQPPVVFRTAEHYMMYNKARLFGDAEAAAQILETWSPRRAKQLGRGVRGFEEAVWNREKLRIVRRGTWCKFANALAEEGDDDDGDGDNEGGEKKRKQAPEGGGSPGGEETTGGRIGVEQAAQSPVSVRHRDEEPDSSPQHLQKTWYLGTDGQACTIQAASFREALLRTGDRELVEASPFDRVWGIGFGAANAERNRGRWGQNLLGKALMEVRDEFRRELEQQGRENENRGEGEGK